LKKIALFFLSIVVLHAAMVSVRFEGNHTFSSDDLYDALGIERKWWQKILAPSKLPKVDDKLLPILFDQLKNFYTDQGFWDVKIDTLMKNNSVVFKIHEHKPIRIDSIQITTDFPIAHLIDLHKGDRFIASKFKATKYAIEQSLLKAGFCSYDLTSKAYVWHKKHKALLVYFLQKGAPCTIGSIEVSGLKTIKKRTVLDHIFLRPNDPFTLDRVKESYRRLYSLGYFRFVNIDYSKKIKNKILLTIDLKERQHRNIYKAGIGYDTQNGIHLNFFYKHLNMHQFQPSIDLFYSKIKKNATFKLFYPSVKLFNHSFDTLSTIAYEQNNFDAFSQKGASLGLKLLKDLYTLQGSLGIKLDRIQIYNTEPCIEAKDYTLIYPQLFAIYDRRDSKLAPQNGFYFKDALDLSITNNHFLKNSFTAGLYLPVADRLTLFSKATLGTITSKSLPPNLLFYAGGINSNRAYTYRAITALDTNCGIGGKTLVDTTIEPRYRYNEKIQIALFWDRTYLSHKEFKLSSPVDGVGAGVIYDTPIGALRLYFGLNPRHPGQNAINLFLGASF